MSDIRVESLHTYPIKSCGGVRIQSPDITEYGLELDRFFMLTDRDGNFISQRTKPELALVQPDIWNSGPDFIDMEVTAPGLAPLILGHETHLVGVYDYAETYVHGKPVAAVRTTKEADDWFSEYLKTPVSLVAKDVAKPRHINDRYARYDSANQAAFADGFPMLLASQASLDEHNRQMAEQTGAGPIPMNRFRPNIVVSGENLEPYDEDYWRRIQIGKMIAYVVRPCKRCAIPYIDQITGQSTGNKAVGKTLATTRRGWDTTKPDDDGKGVFFAQNLAHVYEDGLWITQGQEVIVFDRSDEPNIRLR
jgi:uncharacterized protein YcbX